MMKYCLLFLTLCMLSCQDEPTKSIDQNNILGNWLVVREMDKSTQTTRESDDGITTTWNGVTYISSIKIMNAGTVKINNFDNAYTNTDIEGTWAISQHTSRITFNIQSFTKDFSIRRENDFLILESPTHIIWHRSIQ